MNGGQARPFLFNGIPSLQELFVLFVADQSDFPTQLREAQVRIVLTQGKAIFRPSRHHAIGLSGALGDEIVDQDADVGLIPPQDKRFFALDGKGRVDSRHKPLGRRLFVAAGAVDLPRHVEIRRVGDLKAQSESRSVDGVVLDGIGRAHKFAIFQAVDLFVEGHLHLYR